MFGVALRALLKDLTIRQTELASAVGKSQTALSAYMNGKVEPSPETVFEIESVLRLPPGALSRLLGYLPAEVEGPDGVVAFERYVLGEVTFQQYLTDSPDLEPRVKRVLLATYRALVT